jgi:predicted ATPase/DNA-binding SARP family transcriptional activator
VLEFRMFGGLEAVLDGVPVPLGRPKQRALLAALLLDANRAVSVDRLTEELWANEPPASARHSLEVYVSGLRKTLGADRVVTVAPGYAVRVEPDELDVTRFEQLLQKGRRALAAGRASAARETLEEALALWRGPPLAGIAAGRSVETAVARLADLRVSALEARIDADLELGRHAELVPELQALVAEYSLRETLHGRLMLALYRCGRQADALAAFQDARKTLVDELGIEPSRTLQELERSILNQDPALEHSSVEAGYAPVPVPTASFVGRSAELEALASLLAPGGARLVTLTGPGGIGKTRLAVEAVRTAMSDGMGRMAFVPLAAVRKAEEVPAAIAESLGVREGDEPLDEALKAYLSDREVLFVLDNVEHLLESATMVADLLASCPHVRVLATSRSPLHIYGEHELAVPPLGVASTDAWNDGLSEAARLFTERAQAARGASADDPESAAAVEEICVRLDGMPLAIELAAARVKVLSPKALLARMGRRLQLLVGGPRDAPARHRTLRAAIEWSHDLLAAREQRLFARLAVFSGGFTLDAAEAVCGATVEQIAGLRDNGLVSRVGDDRYGMLETIRELADERLVRSGELAELREKHADYFVALAEDADPALRGPDQLAWLSLLDAEHANVWAALDWAFAAGRPEIPLRVGAALWRYSEARRSIAQARRYLDRALVEGTGAPADVRGRAYFASARLALRQGDLEHARTAFASGEELFRALDDAGGMALCVAGRGWIVHSIGSSGEAVRVCREAVALARSSGEHWIVGDALNNLGVALRTKGDHAGSRAALDESLAIRRAIGDLEGITAGLNGLALLAVASDEIDEAEALFREAFSVSEGRRDLFYDAARDVVLAYVAFARGDVGEAETLSLRALESSRRHGYLQFTAYALELLAGIAAADGRPDDAALLVGCALATAERLGRRSPRDPRPSSPGVRYDWDARAVKCVLADARREVGVASWKAAVENGRSLGPDEAVEYVLDVPTRRQAVQVA